MTLVGCDPITSEQRDAVERRLQLIEASKSKLPPFIDADPKSDRPVLSLDGAKIAVIQLGDRANEARGNAAFVHVEDLADLTRFAKVPYAFGVSDELVTDCAAIVRGKKRLPQRNTSFGTVSDDGPEVKRFLKKWYVPLCAKLDYALVVRTGEERGTGAHYEGVATKVGEAPRRVGGFGQKRVRGDVSVVSLKTGKVLGTTPFVAENGSAEEVNMLVGHGRLDGAMHSDLESRVEAAVMAALSAAGALAP
jgi:hypothetical protein